MEIPPPSLAAKAALLVRLLRAQDTRHEAFVLFVAALAVTRVAGTIAWQGSGAT
jgi:uncharacterized MAPEG superfamily protein